MMTTITGLSSAGNAWQTASSSGMRGGHRADRMFAKTDTDGNGSVDTDELQGLLDNIAQKTGTTAGDATQAMKALDTNDDGQLSKSELKDGIQSLMPAPASTLDFAQQMGGMPPPPPPPGDGGASAGASTSATSSSGSNSTDPLDTNGDGVVSAEERAAGELKTALTDLFSAVDANGDQTISGSEATQFKQSLDAAVESAVQGLTGGASAGAGESTSATQLLASASDPSNASGASNGSGNSNNDSSAGQPSFSSFVDLVLRQYAQAESATSAAGTAAALSVTA